MINRRRFIRNAFFTLGGMTLVQKMDVHAREKEGQYMPDESDNHKRTWMAFVAGEKIWHKKQIPEVKKNLALIANTIAKYEPLAMLVSPDDFQEAQNLLDHNSKFEIELIKFETDDLWLRDTGPTFVVGEKGKKLAIDFNFNGWGNKQEHARDSMVARFIADQSDAQLLNTKLVLEGGCFEVDGNGTAILTRSCVLNDNRNPGYTQQEIEEELKQLLGLKKIIWLEGVKEKDITDGHTDFYARFIQPGEVLVSRDNYRDSHDYEVTRENIEILQNSYDADGNLLNLTIVDTPNKINESYGVKEFAAGYIGYYLCNGAVIAQKFGDREADQMARKILEKSFPDRVVEQIAIDGIASGGGSIHCATQQEIML